MSLNLDKSHWKRVAFGDVVRNVNETVRDLEAAGIDRIIAMEHLDPGELNVSRWGSTEGGTTFSRRVTPGQTLFGKRRAYQRKVAYAEFDAICSGDIYTFEAKETRLLGDLLPFVVQSDGFFEHALGTSAGSLSPRTNWRDLKNFEFNLPPLEEQKRIADLLWTIERYAGHLRTTRSTALKSLEAAANEAFLRFGDQLVCVGDVGSRDAQSVQVGPFGGSLASRHFTDSGTRVLKIQNITDDGDWDLSSRVFVADDYAQTLERYSVHEDDLIVAAQATVGRCALAPEEVAGSLISQHLIRVRLDQSRMAPGFAHAMFMSHPVQDQMRAVKSKTTRDGLNTADVAQFELPCPALEVQSAFVRERRALLRTASQIDVEADALGSLKTAILGEAFGGN